MNRYKASQVVEIGAESIVQLDDNQAKTRMHNLQKLGDDRYRTVKPIQFKRGEVFGLEGHLPKGHDAFVQQVGGEPPVRQEHTPASYQAPNPDPAQEPAQTPKDSGKKKGFFRK